MVPEGTPEVPPLPDLQAMPDMQSLLEQASVMQQQLGDARVTGTAGGGAVTATVSGTAELLALTIDPSVCDPAEAETLADLVVAAVHDATASASRLAADALSDFTAPFGDPTPRPGKLGF
jgi:DNA-binding YbaB/EbfC family protein